MTNNLQSPKSYEKIECYKKQKDISNNSNLSSKNLMIPSKIYGIVSTLIDAGTGQKTLKEWVYIQYSRQ